MDVVPGSASNASVQDCEELAYRLLISLPRSRLAELQRRIAPLLQFDLVGSLPVEVSLQIFSYFPYQTLLTCALVSRRWKTLANDHGVWKDLCCSRGWSWRQRAHIAPFNTPLSPQLNTEWDMSDDEGMGDSDEEGDITESAAEASAFDTSVIQAELDSGFVSFSSPNGIPSLANLQNSIHRSSGSPRTRLRHSAPSVLGQSQVSQPDYKLLYQTHIRLRDRIISSSYRLSVLQTRGAPTNAHRNTIYCLQLYSYPGTDKQVLFTGSRDKTLREWDLSTGLVERVIEGVHTSSVLSLCVHNGFVASAGSDRRVVVWNLEKNKLVQTISDHEDSVLCVRFDDERLVSCSKDRSVRIYSFPDLQLQFVLGAHRAAVNAVSISKSLIVSGSGDRSIRLWDAQTGKLLHTFEDHHSRGIASIDFKPPFVLSGSSDKHIRLFDMTNLQGWSTSPEYNDRITASAGPVSFTPASHSTGNVCLACGRNPLQSIAVPGRRCVHGDLVRSVAFGDDFVISGSYDLSIKVWNRKTGDLVTDLTGGHTGRIFCIGMDYTKIVSCGEDQRICIWDFSHGLDTSFLQLS